uniref:Terribly reduced optic lobes n=1 Tax=Anopheles dirus TaxID=7168 RepID=A0A182NMM6_9DIPT
MWLTTRSACPRNTWQCDYGQCIPLEQKCDGNIDCPDDISDERNCPNTVRKCTNREFQCRVDKRCIPLEKKCNKVFDCADRTDEQVCEGCSEHEFLCATVPPVKSLSRCGEGKFECNDGICIADYKHCNGIVDCHDESDEIRCDNGIQESILIIQILHLSEVILCSNEFSCDGQCYELQVYCNGIIDCHDGKDEANCITCHGGAFHDSQFYCDGRCFEDDRQCDGHQDCSDGSDERDCPVCHEFQCPDGSCFSHSQRCDGRRDCADGYDEHSCPCRSNEFTCGDGLCIPNHQVCNRRPECADGSDERNCSCARNEFRCDTGQCIDVRRHCDQRVDCADGSDERRCNSTIQYSHGAVVCQHNQWKCHNGQCIRYSQRCDRRYDCMDRSDELSCYPTTPPPFDQPRLIVRTYPDEQTIKESNEVVFQCRDEGPMHAKVEWVRENGLDFPPGTRDLNGRLEIPNIRVDHNGQYICQAVGYPKSTPGSSKTVHLTVERYSYQRPPSACAANEATCMNGDCILKTQICDRHRDCADGSDEAGCEPNRQCEPNQFKCRNHKCVLKTWLCDGEQDCGDGSDEENCSTLAPDAPCRYDEYQCRSGQCIPKSFQCDTHPDCLDKSDEVGCMVPSVIQPPPPSLTIPAGGILNITCRATGVPVPLIVWRLNWGHVPPKCTSRSDNGFGRLVCEDMQPIDSGAYSCEIINSMGTHFVSPDTIVIVTGSGPVCQHGTFNSKARDASDCINCFCFGVTTTCNSADLYTYALKPPVSSLTIVGVEGPWNGRRELNVGEFENHNLTAQRHGVQLRLTNLVSGRRTPYYSLPKEYKGNQLKSYGGSIRYDVEYDGQGRPVNAPDVILKGNGMTLLYWHSANFYPDIKNHVTVSLLPNNWVHTDRRPASREEIMMVLASIESILIRMQYVDGIERNIELVNINMDSAAHDDRGLGSASLVEECRCPPGYRGLSCESCEYGYVRQSSGPWLGRCVQRVEECRPGYYGDPNRGIPCSPCPCPVVGEKSRARSCYLDSQGNVVCKCDRGYTGERCMECDVDYVGNPLGDGCFPRPVSNCNALGTERIGSDGRCYCKSGIEGAYCDRCAAQHFYMHDNGCVECFCMGVSNQCSSTSWIRDTIQASFADGRSGFSLISDYTNPSVVAKALPASNREIVYRNFGASDETFYWRLPTQFLGNKLTSFGGHLNYTLRYTPHSSGGVSRNNSPDVVLHSGNKIKLHHYRANGLVPSHGSNTHAVPIREEDWQNYEDGNTVNREYLLMALANVSDIFIKATYNTVSNEAALSHVSLDIARDTPYGGGVRAWPVEQCQCPTGHIGLSCEDCAPGYFKGDQGIYLGLCEPCACNGHSDECDAQTGACLNCRDNTYGDSCELCRPPYVGNATVGTPSDCTLSYPDQAFDCRECDVRGFTGRCQRGCECKQLVEGRRCDQCREGSFGLSTRHETGCLECFCSGVTKSCGTSNLYREELPIIVDAFDNTISLTDRDGNVLESSNFNISMSINEISYTFRDENTYYWSLPHLVLGNQILSYGANLTVTQFVDGGRPLPDHDIILISKGMKLAWSRDHYDDGTFTVPLIERKWTVANRRNSYPASRSDLMTVLSNLDHILIRATTKERTHVSRLSDIALGTAIPTRTYVAAEEVEMCRCPPGYRGTSCECQCPTGHIGLSCEDCAPGYFKGDQGIYLGLCEPCACNGHSDECDAQTGACLNCRDNTYGDSCELCRPPYIGNATVGTPSDCTLSYPDQAFDCRECDVRGFTGRCQRGCECKQLVEGRRCDQCREGSFGLSTRHETGCLECFCSGVTKSCGTSNLYREELPIIVDAFDNTISLTDRDGNVLETSNFNISTSINEISYTFRDENTYYWSLPHLVLGNQILSYGANLTVTQFVDGDRPLPDHDIILISKGMKLAWSRDHYDDGVSTEVETFAVQLIERKWTVANRRNSYPASRSDLMTVLSNLDHILIRATTKERTHVSRLSDIALGTAIPTRTYVAAEEVEMCRCPPGYRGTSCEQCEDLHYRDIYDRHAGLIGTCKPCPCNHENADSCQMDNRGVVVCNCREGYSGENCDNQVDQPRPPITPQNPVIEVVINAPTIQIVEIGDDFRADCRAHYIVTKNPIEVQWTRLNGRMPERAYTDRGTLVITDIQITDGGSYVCKAGSGTEVVYKQVTINVSDRDLIKPTAELSNPFVDQDEYLSTEVRCTATGYPTPSSIPFASKTQAHTVALRATMSVNPTRC